MLRAAILVAIAAGALPGAGLREEAQRFEVKWPTGIGLGEAQIRATRDTGTWVLTLDLEADVPGFPISDRYRSVVDENFCSREFEKEFTHGSKKGKERTTFHEGAGRRETLGGGGVTEFPVSECPRDGLAYLFWIRAELAAGRRPAPQQVYVGSAYSLKMQPAGAATIPISGAPMETDKYIVTITTAKGPFSFELFLARDAERTPAAFRVPFALGNFSMEWIR